MKTKQYETIWIGFSLAAAVLFIVISGLYALIQGFHTPATAGTVDPRQAGGGPGPSGGTGP